LKEKLAMILMATTQHIPVVGKSRVH